jgi:hypothetical protein
VLQELRKGKKQYPGMISTVASEWILTIHQESLTLGFVFCNVL